MGRLSVRKLQHAVGVCAAVVCFATAAFGAATQQQINDFLANPSSLLRQYPNGGARMIAMVRELACTDHSTLPALGKQLGSANKDQQSAIGTGLGQCARSIVNTDQAYANSIAETIASSGSQAANDAYAGVTQNVATAATGAGGGGGGIGGPTGTAGIPSGGGNSGSGGPAGNAANQTAASNFFGGGGVGGTTNAGGSVSPR